ncbi:MAG TPA: AMP-dependent synthetase, partial [Clostridiales bacterium]|nr:AMP-dependent synthetase [Clostridiales bacterium]
FLNFREIINHSAKKFGNRTAFQIKNSDGSYLNITYKNLKERFYALSSNFLSMGLGGKRIAIVGRNCFEWILSYICAATVGVAVPIDKELHSEDIRDFMNSAECEAVCAESKFISELKPMIAENIKCMDFDDISQRSVSFLPKESEVDNITLPKDEMQILIFTSGTTGNSKGVCLSQYNICSNIHSTVSVVRIKPDDKTLSILPLHHTYECTLNCLLLLSRGACITYNDGLTKIQKNLTEYSPTVLVVVPAILNLLNRRISKAIAKDCPDKFKELFETKSLAEALPKIPAIIRKVICAKVKKSLGGKIRLFIVGAAELDPAIVNDFHALGIKTLQGYGLTECSPLLAGNSDFYLNAASTGIAVPGVSLKIDSPNEDGIGEILAKGDNIMLGYYRDQEATDRVFNDGWFCTGDLGCMDNDGSLYIKGRRKNVIVTANGKN